MSTCSRCGKETDQPFHTCKAMTPTPRTDAAHVSVDSGKYTVVIPTGPNDRLHALRYGQPWRDCVGDNLILALASELAESRAEACKARQLETELNELKEENERLKDQRNKAASQERRLYVPLLVELTKERDQLLATVEGLRKAIQFLLDQSKDQSNGIRARYSFDKNSPIEQKLKHALQSSVSPTK